MHLLVPWHFEMSRSSLHSSRAPKREEDGTSISRSSNYGETGNTSPRCVEQAGVDAQPFWHKLSYLRFPLSAVVFVPLLHVNWSFIFFPFWLKHLLLMLTNNKSFLVFPLLAWGVNAQKGKWGWEERAVCHVLGISIITMIMAQCSPEWQQDSPTSAELTQPMCLSLGAPGLPKCVRGLTGVPEVCLPPAVSTADRFLKKQLAGAVRMSNAFPLL